MIAKLKAEIKALKAQVQRLKPQSAPGIRTSSTSRGVTRRPTKIATDGSSTVPRWL